MENVSDPIIEESGPDPLSEALAHVRADAHVAAAVTEAAGAADLQVLRTGPRHAELGADPAKEFALLVSRSHVDLAVGPDVAREHAQRFGFVRQRSNGHTTVIRVASSQLAIAEKRAAWGDLVRESVEHRATCPDRREPRQAAPPTRAARPARPTRSSAATTARATGRATAAAPPTAPLNLCPVHGTEMLGGLCDRCD